MGFYKRSYEIDDAYKEALCCVLQVCPSRLPTGAGDRAVAPERPRDASVALEDLGRLTHRFARPATPSRLWGPVPANPVPLGGVGFARAPGGISDRRGRRRREGTWASVALRDSSDG